MVDEYLKYYVDNVECTLLILGCIEKSRGAVPINLKKILTYFISIEQEQFIDKCF
jgi:hypothetical protein